MQNLAVFRIRTNILMCFRIQVRIKLRLSSDPRSHINTVGTFLKIYAKWYFIDFARNWRTTKKIFDIKNPYFNSSSSYFHYRYFGNRFCFCSFTLLDPDTKDCWALSIERYCWAGPMRVGSGPGAGSDSAELLLNPLYTFWYRYRVPKIQTVFFPDIV